MLNFCFILSFFLWLSYKITIEWSIFCDSLHISRFFGLFFFEYLLKLWSKLPIFLLSISLKKNEQLWLFTCWHIVDIFVFFTLNYLSKILETVQCFFLWIYLKIMVEFTNLWFNLCLNVVNIFLSPSPMVDFLVWLIWDIFGGCIFGLSGKKCNF